MRTHDAGRCPDRQAGDHRRAGVGAAADRAGPDPSGLEQATGLEIEFFAVTSRTIAAEALRAEQVDVVLTGPAEYVVLRKLAGTSSRACRRPAASSTVIDEARAGGAAILGIFHDEDVRDRVVTRRLDLSLPESADA